MGEWWTKTIEIDGNQILFKRTIDPEGDYQFSLTVHAADFLPDSDDGEVTVKVIKHKKPVTVEEFTRFTDEENARQLIKECVVPFLKYPGA